MTPNRVYEKYLSKVEKNSTNDNFSTDKGKAAELYNEMSVRLIKFFLNNRQVDNLKDIQVLLVDDTPIVPETSKEEYDLFPLPKDFLSWSYISAKATKKDCKNQNISLYEIKDEDRADFLSNELFKPSFSYREFPYNFSNNKVKVYKEEGTKVTKILLSYYKYPKKIELQDPENPESNFTQTELELPEHIIDRIISAMVGDFKISNSDPFFELEKMRQNENIQ
jgi:hypothetical protein